MPIICLWIVIWNIYGAKIFKILLIYTEHKFLSQLIFLNDSGKIFLSVISYNFHWNQVLLFIDNNVVWR